MTALITTLLVFTIKALKLVLVIGLVVGSVMAAKKYLFGDEKIDFSLNKFKKEPVTRECPCCKAMLQVEYKFCPSCGSTLEKAVEPKVADEKAVPKTAL